MSEIRDPTRALSEAPVQRLLGHAQQVGRTLGDPPDGHRHRRVAEETVEQHPQVDRDDVPFAQLATRRDAVNHLFVDRRANRGGVPMVPLERRFAAVVPQAALRMGIEVGGRDAGRDHGPELRKDLGHESVRGAHPLELCCRLADDHASARPPARLMASAVSMCARRSAVTLSGGCNPLIDANVGRPS